MGTRWWPSARGADRGGARSVSRAPAASCRSARRGGCCSTPIPRPPRSGSRVPAVTSTAPSIRPSCATSSCSRVVAGSSCEHPAPPRTGRSRGGRGTTAPTAASGRGRSAARSTLSDSWPRRRPTRCAASGRHRSTAARQSPRGPSGGARRWCTSSRRACHGSTQRCTSTSCPGGVTWRCRRSATPTSAAGSRTCSPRACPRRAHARRCTCCAASSRRPSRTSGCHTTRPTTCRYRAT